jgi:hypothetical protein
VLFDRSFVVLFISKNSKRERRRKKKKKKKKSRFGKKEKG